MRNQKDSHAIIDKVLTEGINFLDTANNYGEKQGKGFTGQIIGRWLDKAESGVNR